MKLNHLQEARYDKGGIRSLLKFFRRSRGKEFSDFTPEEQREKFGETYLPKNEMFVRWKNNPIDSISNHPTRGWSVWGSTGEIVEDISEHEFLDSIQVYGRVF